MSYINTESSLFSLTGRHRWTLCSQVGFASFEVLTRRKRLGISSVLRRVFWVDALTVCSVISAGLQLCFSVPDWSPEVFGLALLCVWSGCFWNTNWPVLRPNASLSPHNFNIFPLLLPLLLVTVTLIRSFHNWVQFYAFLKSCKWSI